MTGFDVQEAANSYYAGNIRPVVVSPEYGPMVSASNILNAFSAGAAWQKERDARLADDAINTGLYEQVEAVNVANDAAIERHNELRDALATLAESVAFMLRQQQDLAAMGLRGSDRGVAILKHLQEIGDNVRGVSGAIGDKFGVVLDAVKDVGEKVEACMTIASNTEEGLSVSIEKLDKLGVEKWREAIKHVEAEGTTEPMHAEVKAADYDESGLGKLWADVTVNLEDVSDETLDDLHRSEQIGTARYVEERGRRIAEKIDLGEGLVPRVDHAERSYAAKMRMGVDLSSGPDKSALMIKGSDGEVKFMGATAEQFAVVELSSGAVVILWEGKPYLLRGMDLHPLRFVA